MVAFSQARSYAKYAVGGTMFLPQQQAMAVKRSKSQTRTMSKKKKATSVKGTLKAMMLKNINDHHYTIADNDAIISTTCNTFFTRNVTAGVVQGTNNVTRLGDSIYLDHLILSGNFTTPSTAGAYKFRIITLWSGEETNPANFGTGLSAGQIMLPTTGANDTTNSIINPKAVTVLDDYVVDINSTISGVRDVSSFYRKIRLSQNFLYQDAGSVYGKFKNLYVVVIGSVIGGTNGVTASGDIFTAMDLVFKPL